MGLSVIKLGSYHVNPEWPVFEGDVHKVERSRDGGEDEVCDGQVGNQHVPGGKQDLAQDDDDKEHSRYGYSGSEVGMVHTCVPNQNDVLRIGQRVRPIFMHSGHLIGSGDMCRQIKSIYFLVLWANK